VKGLAHGQIWWADLDKPRPVVVLTRAAVAPLLTRVLVAPITTTIRGLATEVALGGPDGLDDDCVASLDNVQLVPVARLLRQVGQVGAERWQEFCRAMVKVLAC
jgi:mRNA interferase MazF